MPISKARFEPSKRDMDIVALVAKFKQVTAKQVYDLLFFEQADRTTTYRALNRLCRLQYLHRIERRIVGGARGGSGQYVFALGRRGFYADSAGRFDLARHVHFHDLAVTDCFVTLRKLERAGVINITGFSTEPDCWRIVAGIELKPDLYADVLLRSGERLTFWLEMDMGSEAQRQLRGKLEAYWRAWNDSDVEDLPGIVWVGIDEERAKELRWLISQGPADAARLFKVFSLATLANLFI